MANIRALLPILALALATAAPAARATEADVWPDLRSEVFGTKAIAEEDGTVRLDAPIRAEDAAIVPITITIPAEHSATARKVTLLVDHNPSPVAATFTFGPGVGTGERSLTTRLRVDRYTNVRAVVENDDGSLHMATKFVKASGGCSAPAGKDALAALQNLGKMQIKTSVAAPAMPAANEAQLMIKHPNFTGLQMDEITRAFTPAKFVSDIEVKSGGELVFSMTGGISISENPHFRFTYPAGKAGTIEVTAKDSDGETFQGSSQPSGS